ncbi:MAG: mandelate racemase/muconate lactonizing enzyme family protein, partial [Haloferacaceae archaeon]
VYTDAGVVGTGEAYWGGGDAEIIERMTPFVVGENPLDIDRLYEHLIQKTSGEGSISGKVVSAVSGIEIALHDVAGKLLDVPAYQLLGGKYRDAVRIYCDCHAGDESEPAANAAEAERVVSELGYDALKFDLDVPSGHEVDRANRHMRGPEIEHKAE